MNTFNAEFKDLHDIILATTLQFFPTKQVANIKKYNAFTSYTFESIFADQQKSRTKKRLYFFKCILITESCRQFT